MRVQLTFRLHAGTTGLGIRFERTPRNMIACLLSENANTIKALPKLTSSIGLRMTEVDMPKVSPNDVLIKIR